jgi:hypothetical protein
MSLTQQPSIDVEVAIRDDYLDVGLFSTTEVLNNAIADAMLEEIKWQMIELKRM